MTDICTYSGNRDEALIAFLYDDGDRMTRHTFETHLVSCAVCRDELDALKGVRTMLGQWAPPSFVVGSQQSTVNSRQSGVDGTASTVDRQLTTNRRWWRESPAWAQVAAALLFLGVSAGIANLDVRYDQAGLSVRTGWSSPKSPVPSPQAPVASQRSPAVSPQATAGAVTREDLVALERQLRSELRASQGSMRTALAADASPARTASNDAELLRRVRGLLDDSEKRQQRELALRVGQLLQDVNAQRQADLVKIDHSLGLVQNNLGAEVLKQRQSLNLLYRASLRQ